jgi:hypothetical protein
VYVEAFNGKKWGGSSDQYVADISIYKETVSKISTINRKNKNNKILQAMNFRSKNLVKIDS